MWTLQRQEQTSSWYWLLKEPVLFGLLDCPDFGGPSLFRMLHAAGVSTLGQVVELLGPWLDNPSGLAAQLVWLHRSWVSY